MRLLRNTIKALDSDTTRRNGPCDPKIRQAVNRSRVQCMSEARQQGVERVSAESQGRNNGTVRGNPAAAAHATARTLTVREVKVMHMPPKPLKVRAMKIRTERSANNTEVISGGFPQNHGQKAVECGPLTVWFVGSVRDEQTRQPETRAETRCFC